MSADMERRLNRILVALSQNEALMADLDTEAASALLDWASAIAREIVLTTADVEDEETADQTMYPRLRALRQMMRQVNHLATLADLEPAAAILEQFLTQAALACGESFITPTPESRSTLLNIPPANTAEWIASLRTWLANPNTP